MAPNSEEGGRIGALKWDEDTLTKEKQRPPIYNPEDYALSVRKWVRKHTNGTTNLYTSTSMLELDCQRSQNNSFRDYRNPMLTPGSSEMTLRQFGTVSEFLSKLKADLRLSYPSFVQEFVSEPHDGVTLLLELLRAIQLSQGNNGGNTTGSNNTANRVPPSMQRRALLDELSCLQCIYCCCLRYTESVRRLGASSAGLFTLAVCIMSNVNKSRIIALQLLTRACEPTESGHTAVSEAMSTLRLRYGEPVRFRFLIGMLTSAGGQGELLACGIRFINAFLDNAGAAQKRLYIQAELEQAGLDLKTIRKIISINSPSAEMVFEELDHLEKNHIDVEDLTARVERAEKQNEYLKDKVLLLERRVQILQEEKGVLMSLEQCLKERCSELQDEVISLKPGGRSHRIVYKKKDDSTPAEDEGISSSERSLSPEDIQREPSVYEVYNLQSEKVAMKADTKLIDEEETTIDDVIQELKNIINDAETEAYNKERKKAEETQVSNKIQMRVNCNVSMNDPIFDSESEIIPSNLHPQPPRRTRSLIHLFIPSEDYDYDNKEIFFENETPYTSDEGSDSLLSASKCQLPRIEKSTTHFNGTLDVRHPHLKKSESFHHVVSNIQLREVNTNNKAIRHNSIDGYYIDNYPQAPETHGNQQKDYTSHKLKSKSLDRIDDGLDTMVDIVLTNQKSNTSRTQSDSGNATGTTTTLIRSTSNVFLNGTTKDFKISKLPSSSYKSEERHKIFLPHHKYENGDYYYQSRIQEKPITITTNNNNSFVIKRGHTNAGMYSGYHANKNNQVILSNVRKMDKSKNQLNSLSKVTDLPSGLY